MTYYARRLLWSLVPSAAIDAYVLLRRRLTGQRGDRYTLAEFNALVEEMRQRSGYYER